MPTILRTSLHKRYKTSSPFSRASLLALSFLVTLLLVPFILAYASTNFWPRLDVYLETPRYQYKRCLVYSKAKNDIKETNSFRIMERLSSSLSNSNTAAAKLIKYTGKDLRASLETLAPGVNDTQFSFQLSGSVAGATMVESLRIVLEFDMILQVR